LKRILRRLQVVGRSGDKKTVRAFRSPINAPGKHIVPGDPASSSEIVVANAAISRPVIITIGVAPTFTWYAAH